jgi:multiple sugar transport system substrate-binding protein
MEKMHKDLKGKRITRRELLAGMATGAAAIAAAACGSTAPTPAAAPTAAPKAAAPAPTVAPAAPAAPAASKIAGTNLAVLQGSYFDRSWQDFAKKMFEEWGAQNNVKLTVDFLAWPDLQPKIGAAIQAGGVDVVEMWPGWNYLYQNSLLEVTDIAKEVEKAGGGWEQYVLNSAPVGDKFYGIPHGESGGLFVYRISWFKEAIQALGMTKFNPEDSSTMDMTWDEYFQIGAWLKKNKSKPFGQALGHSTGDPPGFTYPYMWSNGAMEREKDLKTVAINKPEFLEALKKFQQAWKDAYIEAGTSWDDAANNKAYLAGEISSTYNGSSIYFTAKRDYKDIAEDSNHMLLPKGKSGERFIRHGTRQLGILKNSKNVETAKAFLTWFFGDKPYGDWFRTHAGYMTGNTKKWSEDPMWQQDKKVTIYRDVPKYGRVDGYAGPTDAKAAEVYSKYIVVDMYAKIATGADPEATLKDTESQLKRIYGG